MNKLVNKYGTKGAQDFMQGLTVLLFAIIIILLALQLKFLKLTNALLLNLVTDPATIIYSNN